MFASFNDVNTDVDAAPFELPDDIRDLPNSGGYGDDISKRLFPDIFGQGLDIRLKPLDTLHNEPSNSLFGKSPFDLPFAKLELRAPSDETIQPPLQDADDLISEGSQDIWLDPATLEAPPQARFLTWDSFLPAPSAVNPYLIEASPRVFDAVLSKHLDDVYSPDESGSVIRSDLFCYCLLYLALGQESVLFQFNQKKFHFYPVRANLRISGTTVGVTDAVYKEFAECGRDLRKLRRYTGRVYEDYDAANPFTVALAECVNSAVKAVQERIAGTSRSVSSIVQLQDVVREPALVLHCFTQVVKLTEISNEQHILLGRMFELVQKLEYRNGWLRPVLLQMLARVSGPWLDILSDWVGLGNNEKGLPLIEEAVKHLFVKHEDVIINDGGEYDSQVLFDAERVPAFMNTEDARTIFETGRALRVLESSRPSHPLLQTTGKPHLEWKFSWDDIERIQVQAASYENSIRRTIKTYNAGQLPISMVELTRSRDDGDFDPYTLSADDVQMQLSASMTDMNISPSTTPDYLHYTIMSISSNSSIARDHLTVYASPLSITPMLSFSHMLSVQSRLTNSAITRLFFQEFDIRKHLSLLYRFQLCGDGVFVSRLSHALFDGDMDSAERGEGNVSGGVMGLKLGARDTWPPASSELRLALAGILTDCYRSNEKNTESTGAYTHRKDDLPGGLSFTVRDMDEEELRKCMDPNSLSALDFLRLRYKPPSPLDAVITPAILWKYDKLFRLLLRVLRMLFVTNRIWVDMTSKRASSSVGLKTRDDPMAQKFRIEAHHFVSSISQYFFESGIAITWQRFEEKLADLEKSAKEGGESQSLGRLVEYHERVLDQMLFATLSRKRQAPVMKIVEEIFGIVLTFARYVRQQSSQASPVVLPRGQVTEEFPPGSVEKMHRRFSKRVAIFISVCRGLSEKRGYGDGKAASKREETGGPDTGLFKSGDQEEGGMLGQLLVRLEMTGWYTASAGKASAPKTPGQE